MGRYDKLCGILMWAGIAEAERKGIYWTADLFALNGETHRLMGFSDGSKVWTREELQACADWLNERQQQRAVTDGASNETDA